MAKCNFKIQELVQTHPEFVWKDLIEGPPLYIQGYFDALQKLFEGDNDYEYGRSYRMLDAQNNVLPLKYEIWRVSTGVASDSGFIAEKHKNPKITKKDTKKLKPKTDTMYGKFLAEEFGDD